MRKVHVECLPDETLVKKLGITRKMVTHHFGKSRVYNRLMRTNNEIAMVDEDPQSIKSDYEKQLIFVQEGCGIKIYKDMRDNKILVLKIKLEDWIIAVCKEAQINITNFGLPQKPNDLHDVINHRLTNFEKLIDHLKQKENPCILQLMNLLN
jgi:hypothetical protein